MIQLSKPGKNHRMLGALAGIWTFTGKHFADDPNEKPLEFKGKLTRKPLWGGRYFMTETMGEKIRMPWANGPEVPYRDMTLEGFDNARQKFVRAMINNHWDTGILNWEGTFDPNQKTISFDGVLEPEPGVRIKSRLLLRLIDQGHYVEEGYEEHGGQQVKVTELEYTRVPIR
jgi:hypothetical protein